MPIDTKTKIITIINMFFIFACLPIVTALYIKYEKDAKWKDWIKWVYMSILFICLVSVFINSYLLSDFKSSISFVLIALFIFASAALAIFSGFFEESKQVLFWNYIGLIIIYFIYTIDANKFLSLFPTIGRVLLKNKPFFLNNGHVHTRQQYTRLTFTN